MTHFANVYDQLTNIILRHQVKYGKPPDSITITEDAMDELASMAAFATAGIINDSPPGAPKDILFKGVKIEILEIVVDG